jgi:hypothetical protein
MRVCHGVAARFDDPNLVSCAGLVPILQLAERAGFEQLVAEHVSIAKPGGVNAELKVSALVAGMVAGADSIDDMAVLRHGGMARVFGGVRRRRWGRSCGRSRSAMSVNSTRSRPGC